jgi:hypothetical protein
MGSTCLDFVVLGVGVELPLHKAILLLQSGHKFWRQNCEYDCKGPSLPPPIYGVFRQCGDGVLQAHANDTKQTTGTAHVHREALVATQQKLELNTDGCVPPVR